MSNRFNWDRARTGRIFNLASPGVLAALCACLGVEAWAAQLDLPGPPGSGEFGTAVAVLPNGNFVVTDPGYDRSGVTDVGAVHLYDGVTLALISTITGSSASDWIGRGGICVLSNGHYVVCSPSWSGARGAVTWCNGVTGVSGVVSANNSLVGSMSSSEVGSAGVVPLPSGHYVVRSPNWRTVSVFGAGAVTWCNGTTGTTGLVSVGNSLVGGTEYDFVGIRLTVLNNGNFVVISPNWDSGTALDAGAVTWASGVSGLAGVVSANNSLVGRFVEDRVGSGGVTVLGQGNYVVSSPDWNNNPHTDLGAVTWCNGVTGRIGPVTTANSLVGGELGLYHRVGSGGVTALSNGHYVVNSPEWNEGRGAVTWASGTSGVVGVVSTNNSLVGDGFYPRVGSGGVSALSNGHYVVNSPSWNDQRGAVTWASGTSGVVGVVSTVNSLVGGVTGDLVGSGGVTALHTGHYVVNSPSWNEERGAVTWANGTSGGNGLVAAANSLVGSVAGDQVGNRGVTALNTGSFVVRSPWWNGQRGAATWASGTAGLIGAVSAANSLVGAAPGDQVGSGDQLGNGGVTALNTGSFVVSSPWWNGQRGAATWASGTAGLIGAVSAASSLVGAAPGDQVGSGGVTALLNGHYVVSSPEWDNQGVFNAGAATWGSGATGVTGLVSLDNSLVGNRPGDQFGSLGVTAVSTGDYLVRSPSVDNGPLNGAGAVSLGLGFSGSQGPVTATNNSVLGTVSGRGGALFPVYDDLNTRLIVGQAASNRVSIFAYPTPLTARLNGRRGSFLNTYQLLADNGGDEAEFAAYVSAPAGSERWIHLMDPTTFRVLATTNLSAGDGNPGLLVFTNVPSMSYELQVSGIDDRSPGTYDVALYPVVRSGTRIDGMLSEQDPGMASRTAAVGSGQWRYDDYLLRGGAPGDRISLAVELASFAPFLEIRLLADESVQDYRDGSSYTLTVQGTAQGARDYLIRVTSSASGALGDYTLRVNRVQAVPEIWSFSPGSGGPGTKVLVRGTNFLDGSNPVVTSVEFGGAPGNWDDPVTQGAGQEFMAEVPPGALSGPIRVFTVGATGTSANAFIVLSPAGGIRREVAGGISFAVSNAAAGIQNVVEHATTLTPPFVWTPVSTNVSGAGVWRYTNATPGPVPQQFFRVRRQ